MVGIKRVLGAAGLLARKPAWVNVELLSPKDHDVRLWQRTGWIDSLGMQTATAYAASRDNSR